jgi:tetratricopeptide (TPR) repeat protein
MAGERCIGWEIPMKIIAKDFVRCTAAMSLVAVCTAVGWAQTQNSLKFRLVEQQKPTSTGEVGVITPELLADLMVVHGHFAEAIEAYRKLQPQTAAIYNKIGIAYQRMAMDQDAIASYDQATHLDRKFAAPYNNLGTIYFRQNDNKRAQQLYKKSIKLDAATAPYWSNLGAVYMAERKYSDGAEAYEKAFLLNPNIFQEIALNGMQHNESPEELARMYLTFAEIYAHAGMKAQAILYLHKAIEQGLKGGEKLQDDQQLATLHGSPEFDAMAGIHPK